jgi:hypothetical protein
MPKVTNAPEELNKLLEKVYAEALTEYKGNKAKASAVAWKAAENAGWSKDKDGKWMKAKKEMADISANDFVIFKAGVWNGETFTEKDLDNMAKSFNSDEPPHFFLGHSSDYKGKTMIPSWGRIKGGLKRVGSELIASGAEFNEQMAKWIKEGFFGQRSIELTKDNKTIVAVGLLGVIPPAVKNLPLMQEVFKEGSLQFSDLVDTKTIEFTDIVNETPEGKIKELSESCGRFIETMEKLDQDDPESIVDEVIEFQEEIIKTLNVDKSKTRWTEFTEKLKQLFKGKDTEVDAKLEVEYQEKIATQEVELKEFREQKRLAEEARVQAELIVAKDELIAKEGVLKGEIKNFCELKIKENKMTPADREKDEPIMFTLAKTNLDALKSFQEKYTKEIVPLDEVDINKNQDNDMRPQVIKNAEKYAVDHKADKEFAGLEKDQATKRAMFLYSKGEIKFGDNK